MKMCDPHMAALRAAIVDRGLGHLIAADPDAASVRIAEDLEAGGDGKATFEPLIGAHNGIFYNAIRVAGPSIIVEHEGKPEKCPICHLNKPEWIDGAADNMLRLARKFGLVVGH